MSRRLLPLLLALLLLTGCAGVNDPLAGQVTSLDEDIPAPLPAAPQAAASSQTATLYFRYLDEPFLAPESRALTVAPGRSTEAALVDALLAGPGIRFPHLTALFPAGTRALSVVRQGRTLFVTLSREIMDAYPDEPQDGQNDRFWAQEAPLRRRLCMQSLVATVTENCDLDTVQVLVEQSSTTDSLRLRQAYYLDGGDPQALADPLLRDDSLLLTPSTTLNAALSLWQTRDWTRLARYALAEDEEALREQAAGWPLLLDYAFTGPTMSEDGRTATFTLTATIRDSVGPRRLEKRVLRLFRDGGLWRVPPEQLSGWLEGGG